MSVNKEFARPTGEDEFEAMCHALYRKMWNDTSCTRVGGRGQVQFGVDILGFDGKKTVGVQCKHYSSKPFTLKTVTDDIEKAEKANLVIEHLLFATTAASKSELVRQVHELSSKRRKENKFTVSVDFWSDISGHIRLHQEIGREYIPDFPGARILNIEETGNSLFALYQDDREENKQYQAASIELQHKMLALLQKDLAPAARGDEVDPHVVESLDRIRDKLREGKTHDAALLLGALGDPAKLTDQFSRFRWHTNHAAVALLEGQYEAAADEYIKAFQFAKDNEKAHGNRAHAFLLKNDATAALAACDDGLKSFPENALLWSVKLHARLLLGEPEPEKDIPESLLETPDMLFSRAGLRSKQGDHASAVTLLRQCLAADGSSFDSKRSYLADALAWAAGDPVMAHHGQLTPEQRDALKDAVQRLEPLEKTLPLIQSDYVAHEIANNVTVCLMLLGHKERARALATHFLLRHPLSEGLLRIRLYDLDLRNDIEAIHELTDNRLEELPTGVLGILAEMAANKGDLQWYGKVMELLEKSNLEQERLRDLRVLSIHAQWIAGNRNDAIEATSTYIQEHSMDILPRVMLGQMMRQLGRKDEALQEAMSSKELLSVNNSSLELLLVAELFFDLGHFLESASLYEKLVHVPNNDEFTRRLLICLLESGQRKKAKDTLNKLSADVLALPQFRRIEANLARIMGDWERMRDLLALELERTPDNSGIAIGYVGALYRLNEEPRLSTYLASNPQFKNAPPENEFEFAKYQSNLGFSSMALNRLYRLYRFNPSSTQVASFYLGQLLLGKPAPELDTPIEAGPGTVIHLRSSAETKIVAIDIEVNERGNSWPELISCDSEMAKIFSGLKLGNKVTIPQWFGEENVEIVGLESLYNFVGRKANELVATAATPSGPIWSVRIVKDDGELNLDMLLKSAQQRSQHVQNIFANYQQQRFPLCMLARAIGSDTVTLLAEWPNKVAPLFVGFGTHEEQAASIKILQQSDRRYVLDLLTIAELIRTKSLEATVKLLGRPLVPKTVREHLIVLLQFVEQPRPSANLGEQDGRLVFSDTPQSYYDQRELLLKEMLRCIDELCEVLPTAGPQEITEFHRVLSTALDNDTLDALYLSMEKDAVLISEDGALRLWATSAGVPLSMGIQPILMEACNKGLLSSDTYTEIMAQKLAEGHNFVSIRSDDLLTLAKQTPTILSEKVRIALESFRRPSLDIISATRVCVEFLAQAIQSFDAKVAANYGNLILEVLQHEREELADEIHHHIADIVKLILTTMKELNQDELKLFANLLTPPKRPMIELRLTPIISAIRKIYN